MTPHGVSDGTGVRTNSATATNCVIIVAFLENATIGYSLESLSLCACASVLVCVCFCMITQKEIDLGTRNRNTL